MLSCQALMVLAALPEEEQVRVVRVECLGDAPGVAPLGPEDGRLLVVQILVDLVAGDHQEGRRVAAGKGGGRDACALQRLLVEFEQPGRNKGSE